MAWTPGSIGAAPVPVPCGAVEFRRPAAARAAAGRLTGSGFLGHACRTPPLVGCLVAGGRRGQYGWDRDQEPAGGIQRRRARDRDHPAGHRDPPPEVHEGERLAHALWAQWPSYIGYLVSFLTIGVIWLNHHRLFEQVARVDGPLLLLNLNLLLWTALIPFPTAVVAEHLREGADAARTALALYSGVLLMMSLAFGGLFAWITHDDRLLHRLPPPGVVRAARPLYGRAGGLHRRLRPVVGVAACPGVVWAHGVVLRLRPGDGAR
jgi:hypothetical protein